jgi:hypothetical protein
MHRSPKLFIYPCNYGKVEMRAAGVKQRHVSGTGNQISCFTVALDDDAELVGLYDDVTILLLWNISH